MKLPITPPNISDVLTGSVQSIDKIFAYASGPAPHGKYRHWDTLRHLKPPEGLTAEEWWLGIKFARKSLYQALPLRDKDGDAFVYAIPSIALQLLQEIDRDASGNLEGSPQVTDPQTRDTYLFKSLVEEAITSSQLEGASTTRRVAKEMIQTGRPPNSRGEQMVLNNYQAMIFVRDLKGEELTPSHVLELQRILTVNAIDEPDASGRLRKGGDDIHVADETTGEVFHIPPDWAELPERLESMCAFANGRSPHEYVHPVVRAVVLHFWLAYDHPFVDGNGRTARALFYWSMARQGYWLCEFLSISRILKKARAKYARAFLYTETDENDATYFLLYQLRVVRRAIDELHEYLKIKGLEIRETAKLLGATGKLHRLLSYRQLALLNHGLKNPGSHYTIESHRRSHQISYGTARSDLLQLARLEFLQRQQVGKAFDFVSPHDLKRRIMRYAE